MNREKQEREDRRQESGVRRQNLEIISGKKELPESS